MSTDYQAQPADKQTWKDARPVAATLVSPRDHHARLQRIDRLTSWLDKAIRVPGTQFHFGWDTIIGLVPGIGDLATAGMSAWIINEARLLGVSKITLSRMIANVGLDALVGAVPVVGDLFDATFKSNVKNLVLLKRDLHKKGILKTPLR